jgi:hypothetical protein|tara:strand:+ start:51 stop:275 length:225 start_codon:yes stop_codon:yes gene_type:complete
VKYLFLTLILVLTSCSLDKNSAYWNKDSINKTIEDKKLSKIKKKTTSFESMTLNDFNLFLKDYADKTDYPDLKN